jgi:hypothetical protein
MSKRRESIVLPPEWLAAATAALKDGETIADLIRAGMKRELKRRGVDVAALPDVGKRGRPPKGNGNISAG